MSQDLVNLLKRARDRWLTAPTKGEYARTESGMKCEPNDPAAACWCAYGALLCEVGIGEHDESELACDASGAIGYQLRRDGQYTWLIRANDAGVLTKEHWDAAIVAHGGEP